MYSSCFCHFSSISHLAPFAITVFVAYFHLSFSFPFFLSFVLCIVTLFVTFHPFLIRILFSLRFSFRFLSSFIHLSSGSSFHCCVHSHSLVALPGFFSHSVLPLSGFIYLYFYVFLFLLFITNDFFSLSMLFSSSVFFSSFFHSIPILSFFNYRFHVTFLFSL